MGPGPIPHQISGCSPSQVYGAAAPCFWLELRLDARTNPCCPTFTCITQKVVPWRIFHHNLFCWGKAGLQLPRTPADAFSMTSALFRAARCQQGQGFLAIRDALGICVALRATSPRCGYLVVVCRLQEQQAEGSRATMREVALCMWAGQPASLRVACAHNGRSDLVQNLSQVALLGPETTSDGRPAGDNARHRPDVAAFGAAAMSSKSSCRTRHM